MTKKTQFRLTVLAGILLFILAVISFWDPVQTMLVTRSEKPFQSIKTEEIFEITISQGETKVNLQKENDSWYIVDGDNKQNADTQRIENIISSFTSITKTNIISSNENRQEEFGINADNYVTFKTPKQEHTILIGNQSRASNSYAIVDSTNNIYSVAGFNTLYNPIDYRDLNVNVISDATKVTQIAVKNKANNYTIVKSEDSWNINGEEVDASKIDTLIQDISSLKGESIVDELPESVNSDDPSTTITIKVADKEKVLNIWEQTGEGKTFYAQVSGSDVTYIVNEFIVNLLTKNPSEFALEIAE